MEFNKIADGIILCIFITSLIVTSIILYPMIIDTYNELTQSTESEYIITECNKNVIVAVTGEHGYNSQKSICIDSIETIPDHCSELYNSFSGGAYYGIYFKYNPEFINLNESELDAEIDKFWKPCFE